jgi:hypothetical protein
VSAVGETPVTTDRPELGRCRFCGAWTRGPWVEDLTAHIAIVEHCPDPDADQDDKPV